MQSLMDIPSSHTSQPVVSRFASCRAKALQLQLQRTVHRFQPLLSVHRFQPLLSVHHSSPRRSRRRKRSTARVFAGLPPWCPGHSRVRRRDRRALHFNVGSSELDTLPRGIWMQVRFRAATCQHAAPLRMALAGGAAIWRLCAAQQAVLGDRLRSRRQERRRRRHSRMPRAGARQLFSSSRSVSNGR
jgi:hypothetical protein